MAEYIDKKYLDRKFQIDMMCLRCGTIFDNQKIIDSLPTADVVEREKIDDAIEEIKGQFYVLLKDETSIEELWWNNALEKTLEILKRNIGE